MSGVLYGYVQAAVELGCLVLCTGFSGIRASGVMYRS